MDIKDLLDKLSIYYWSESRPSSYTIKHPVSGAQVGLGAIAHKCYAAFNLTYALHGPELKNLEQHWEAAGTFGLLRHMLEQPEAEEVSDMLTLLPPEEFRKWYFRKAMTVPEGLRSWIQDALTNIEKVHKI
jgi:hypothetical protein